MYEASTNIVMTALMYAGIQGSSETSSIEQVSVPNAEPCPQLSRCAEGGVLHLFHTQGGKSNCKLGTYMCTLFYTINM